MLLQAVTVRPYFRSTASSGTFEESTVTARGGLHDAVVNDGNRSTESVLLMVSRDTVYFNTG